MLLITLKSEYNIYFFITVSVCSLHGLTSSYLSAPTLCSFSAHPLEPHAPLGLCDHPPPRASCSLSLLPECPLPDQIRSDQIIIQVLHEVFPGLPNRNQPRPHRISIFIFLVSTKYHDLKLF